MRAIFCLFQLCSALLHFPFGWILLFADCLSFAGRTDWVHLVDWWPLKIVSILHATDACLAVNFAGDARTCEWCVSGCAVVCVCWMINGLSFVWIRHICSFVKRQSLPEFVANASIHHIPIGSYSSNRFSPLFALFFWLKTETQKKNSKKPKIARWLSSFSATQFFITLW